MNWQGRAEAQAAHCYLMVTPESFLPDWAMATRPHALEKSCGDASWYPNEEISALLPGRLQMENLLGMMHILVVVAVLNIAADLSSYICKGKPSYGCPLKGKCLERG